MSWPPGEPVRWLPSGSRASIAVVPPGQLLPAPGATASFGGGHTKSLYARGLPGAKWLKRLNTDTSESPSALTAEVIVWLYCSTFVLLGRYVSPWFGGDHGSGGFVLVALYRSYHARIKKSGVSGVPGGKSGSGGLT